MQLPYGLPNRERNAGGYKKITSWAPHPCGQIQWLKLDTTRSQNTCLGSGVGRGLEGRIQRMHLLLICEACCADLVLLLVPVEGLARLALVPYLSYVLIILAVITTPPGAG